MGASSPAERVEQALSDPDPAAAVLAVACGLRDKGMSQSELLALYDGFRDRHPEDIDETRLDAVMDTMDFIVGFCTASRRLYPDADC